MNQQQYSTAKRELERRRQRAEIDAMARREELYKAVPRFVDLERMQTEAGAKAAALAADGMGEEAKQLLAEMKMAAQQKQVLFKQMGYSEAMLQPQYHCKKCGDTGRWEGKICECLQEDLRRMRREDVNESGPLSLCRFESFSLDKYPEKGEDGNAPRSVMRGILTDCKDYAQEFGHASGSLFLYGDAGLGKTHLALSVASVVLDRGFDVIYVSAQSAFSAVSGQRFEQGATMFTSMMQADLLILDDLGTEFIDAYILSKLYELVNGRLRKPTIYTTNIARQDLLYQRYTEKIASRLLGDCHLMRFYGNDIRLMRD